MMSDTCLLAEIGYNRTMIAMEQADKHRIALVDDEESILTNIAYALNKEGFQVSTYKNGEEAWNAFQDNMPDLAVLDVMMPRMDGISLCRKIRENDRKVPLLFLSSRDEEIDRILGLEMGGDDYLCKPFSIRELVVRIKVLLRRVEPLKEGAEVLVHGPLELDKDSCRVRWKGENLPVTLTEFRILESLIRYPGTVKSREQLMKAAFPKDNYVSDRAADSHIKRLRKKLDDTDGSKQWIETVYGLGYRFCEN